MSSCRTSSQRPAPSDVRIAISFSRAAARASSMLATLVHAISNSTPTAANSVYSVVRNCRTRPSTQLTTCTVNCGG